MRVGLVDYNSHVIFDRLEFFAPRCKFCEPIAGHLFGWPMFQKKFQISVNVQVMCFCYLNHGIYHSTDIGSGNRITEQPVLPSNCKWTDRILTEVICKAAAPIFKIGLRCFPPIKHIIHRFIHTGILGWLLLFRPRPESLQNRFFLLETQLLPFFIITRIFFVDGILYGEQPVIVLDSPHCRLAVIIRFPFGNRIDKVSADMCPAGTPFDIRQVVIALITIGFQIPMVPF